MATQFDVLPTLNSPFVLLDDQSVVSVSQGRKDFLTTSLRKTISEQSKNEAGFFVMAEGAQIDYGGHASDVGYVVKKMLDFDKAVGEALEKNSTLLGWMLKFTSLVNVHGTLGPATQANPFE